MEQSAHNEARTLIRKTHTHTHPSIQPASRHSQVVCLSVWVWGGGGVIKLCEEKKEPFQNKMRFTGKIREGSFPNKV